MGDDLNISVERKLVLGASDVTKLLIKALGLPSDAFITDDEDMGVPKLIIRWSTVETFSTSSEEPKP